MPTYMYRCDYIFDHDGIFSSQSAVGWDYQAQLAKHESQKDAAKGFGGRYGVQKERQDKVLADTVCRHRNY